jgi:hypothetical protein
MASCAPVRVRVLVFADLTAQLTSRPRRHPGRVVEGAAVGDLDRCGCTAPPTERRHCEGDNTARGAVRFVTTTLAVSRFSIAAASF